LTQQRNEQKVANEVASDERTAAVQSRNIRYTWLALNYALAGDIVYRGYFLRQDFTQFADVSCIWVGANLFFVVLDLATGGMTGRAVRISGLPTLIIGAVVAAGAALALVAHTNPWLVTIIGFGLALAAILITVSVRRSRRRREP